MNQYCRYCARAALADEDCFYCDVDHQIYDENKAKRVNKCKDFEFNPNDIFRCDEYGNFAQYKPRAKNPDKQLKIPLGGEEE